MGFLSHIKGLLTGAVLAAVLLSCNPLDGADNLQKGYWYDLEIPAVVQFSRQGGAFTLQPVGITYFDGQLISKKSLSEDEVEIIFLEGSEDFLSREGFTFITGQTSINQGAYFKVVWHDKGVFAHLSILQYNNSGL